MSITPRRFAWLPRPLALSLLLVSPLAAQQARVSTLAPDEDTIVLSPFEVQTAADQGYRATNSISGSRINTPIKELPMPIEVITADFLRDVGASDLRQSLRYSAGIILQSQNDQSNNTFYGPGGVNNPEGVTANKTQSTIKIRGYVTDVVLRDGYRRQSATDSINIGRIEVVRGPAALLYGIGNFGGIVNYLPKMPELKPFTDVSLAYGSHGFMRGTIDTTGPLGDRMSAAYRLTAAVQGTGNHTELYDEKHFFVSPSFSFRPAPKTLVLVDLEYGKMEEEGLGFLSVRARSDIDGVGQADRLQSSGFVEFAGKNPRTFRWSGPDTYRETEQGNARVQLTHELAENLHLLAGYNTSRVTFDSRDVNGAMEQNVGPVSLRDTITVIPIDSANGSSEFTRTQTPNTIFKYNWSDLWERNEREQVRAELNYQFDLFKEHNRWLAIESSLLLGRSYERADRTTRLTRTRNNLFNFKRPTDTTYIRFGQQGDGSADAPMTPINRIESTGWNTGDYGVYQGKFFDNRLIVVAGLRKDKNDYGVASQTFHPNTSTSSARRPTQRDTTEQYGATLQLIPQLSVYALKAGGLQPNFDGLRDATGAPLGPVEARSKEIGLKIDLLDGRISGTISSFKIERRGVPFGQWWMPTLKGTFDANRPIVYNVGNFSPSSVPGGSNGGNGAADAALPEWNAGVAAGSIYQLNVGGNPNWYVNASQPTGAAYLDRVFNLTKTTLPGWPGWLYISDANTNNSWEDRGDGNGWQAFVQQEDESEGWDAQIMFTPNDNFQFLVTYANTKRVITNPGRFIKYPHPENRWAIWYFPDGNWGLTGYDLNEVYTDPTDTSTWTGIGWGAGQSRDDTPKHAVSSWSHYRVTDGSLKGLSFGLGGQWESEREYFSGVTVAGQKQSTKDGDLIILKHKDRISIDAMVKYEFDWQGRPAYGQLNVNNLLDDRDLYGLIYAPGLSARLEFGVRF
jgi:iron complex outermembrane recepter protein